MIFYEVLKMNKNLLIKEKDKTNIFFEKGFTLVEVSIVIVLLLVVVGAIFGLQYSIGKNQLVVWKNYVNLNDTNSTLQEMMREIRSAQVSASGAYPLEKLEDNEIIFYSDSDYDSVIEKIRYTRSGTNLVKGVTKPTGQPPAYSVENEKVKTVSEYIRNGTQPVFYYYNGNWPTDVTNNPLSQNLRLASTRGIACYLKMNESENDSRNDLIMQSFAQIRVLKDNL